jgi:hypothetical protein
MPYSLRVRWAVEASIQRELAYQSAMELADTTFEKARPRARGGRAGRQAGEGVARWLAAGPHGPAGQRDHAERAARARWASGAALPKGDDDGVSRIVAGGSVRRLDGYKTHQGPLFDEVVEVVKRDFFKIIRRQALAGRAIIRSEDPVFSRHGALDMALDLLSERCGTRAAVLPSA